MFPVPATPTFPSDHASITRGPLRYEDCLQDGRFQLLALPAQLAGLWQTVLGKHAGARNAMASGVVPILTRLVIVSDDQGIRVDRGVEAHSGFALAHGVDDAGEVSRLFMNTWTEVFGTAGRIAPLPVEGERVRAGTVFAEHTFTRLFAPPDQRKVTRLAVEGYPALPPDRHTAHTAASAQELPTGAIWLDELAPDSVDTLFTLDQTDGNQHVNSLVYVRVFVDAISRRLAAGNHSLKLRSHAVDITYRKPCFAGDRVRAHLRLFQLGDQLGASGSIVGTDDKPRAFVRVLLQR